MAAGSYTKIFLKKTRTLWWLYREKLHNHLALKAYYKSGVFKSLLSASSVPLHLKAGIKFKFLQQLSNKYDNRVVKRCLNSGRTRFVTRRYLLSRMRVRYYLSIGKVPNTTKFIR